MDIHNLSKADILSLIDELNQYKLGNVTTEGLSQALTETLDAVKKLTTNK